MKPLFFKNSSGGQLYGVYHGSAKTSQPQARAVVICPPLGQEYIRTHWACKLLAKQLARGGAHVLRFDWTGHGNSSSDIVQQKSLPSWTDDLGQAIDWIREKSNASSVTLLGLRFGASLAALTAQQRPDINSLVAWEPVIDGGSYLHDLRTMHARMIDLWHSKTSTPNNSENEEILGFSFSRSLLKEIEQVKLNLRELYLPQLIIDLQSNPQAYSHIEPSLQRTLRTDDEANWNQLSTLETAWLRPQTTRLIVKTVADMFDRLQRIGALDQLDSVKLVGAK